MRKISKRTKKKISNLDECEIPYEANVREETKELLASIYYEHFDDSLKHIKKLTISLRKLRSAIKKEIKDKPIVIKEPIKEIEKEVLIEHENT